MKHFLSGENIGLVISRQAIVGSGYSHIMASRHIVDNRTFYSNKGITLQVPLYLYPDTEQPTLGGNQARKPNLDAAIVEKISKKLKLPFVPDHELPEADGKTAFSPLDLLDYIYAVLHSPAYRSKYKEFLKIDFPRIPFPEPKTFWQLVALGREVRLLHLLESPKLAKLITTYPADGDNKVEKPEYKNGNVYINKTQYFGNVPEVAWNFYIGGYQPAQKWLKDRKGRTLSFDDIQHYQRIIIALTETDKLMKQIDGVLEV
jgi:predicted helicase